MIDGSFVMPPVEEPGDIDLILVMPKDWDMASEVHAARHPDRAQEGTPEDLSMIHSEEGYQLTLEQLGRLERALESLRRDVLPKNEARYRLLAEPYEEKIEELRSELQEYRSRVDASAAQAPRPGYLKGYPAKATFLVRVRRYIAAA